ncbi:hypothetical protein MKX03_006693, partial [Papaver bracteatum]
GTQIHAKVKKEDADLFEGKFKDNHIYSIDRICILVPTGKYRIVSYRYIMLLGRFSKVQQLDVDISTFPKQTFSFLELDNLPTRKNNNTYYTYVIGRLSSVSNTVRRTYIFLYTYIQIVKTILIAIFSVRGTIIKITLWSKLADVIKDGILENSENQPIIHLGVLGLATTDASRLMINPDFPEVTAFKQQLDLETIEIEQIPLQEEQNPYENIISLLDLTDKLQDSDSKDKAYNCRAKVIGLAENKSWNYTACNKCHRKIVEKDGQEACPKCKGTYNGISVPWYRIQLRVEDEQETAVFTVIGTNAENMLKYTAEEHVTYQERCEQLNRPERTLKIFDRIKNENFIFKVLITDSNIRCQSDNFKVLKVYTTENENSSNRGRKRNVAILAPNIPPKKKTSTEKTSTINYNSNQSSEEEDEEEHNKDISSKGRKSIDANKLHKKIANRKKIVPIESEEEEEDDK